MKGFGILHKCASETEFRDGKWYCEKCGQIEDEELMFAPVRIPLKNGKVMVGTWKLCDN